LGEKGGRIRRRTYGKSQAWVTIKKEVWLTFKKVDNNLSVEKACKEKPWR